MTKKEKNRKYASVENNNYRHIGGKTRKELLHQIKFCTKKNDFDKALLLIDDYLKEHSTDYYMMIYKAMTLTKTGRAEEAKQLCEEILKYNLNKQNRIFCLTQYAASFNLPSEIDLAIEKYKEAIEMSDKLELSARGKLANLYCRKRDFDKALDILSINGFNNEFLNIKRASVYIHMEQYSQAISSLDKKSFNKYDYEESENMDEKYLEQEKNYLLGSIYYKSGNLDKAYEYLSQATNVQNRIYFEANLRIAKIYNMKGNADEAIALAYETLKKCTSNYYQRIFNEIIADAYIRKNDYNKAEEIYNKIDAVEEIKNAYFGKMELIKGNFEKAEEYFSYLDIENENVVSRYDEFYRSALIKLRLGKYDEVRKIINKFEENKDRFAIKKMMIEINRIKLYIGDKKEDMSNLNYTEQQILSYDEEYAIDHIIDHHHDNPKISKFYEGVDIRQLFVEIKNMLNSENIIYDSIFDKYIVKYNKIGTNLDNGNIHEVLVLTIPGTTNIVTMYPYDGDESIFYVEEFDKEPEKEEEKPKIKALTGLERFKRKYGTNV